MTLRIFLSVTLVLLGTAGAARGFRSERPSGSYTVDAQHSMVIFGINHLKVSNFYGRFNEVSGEFVIDDENPAGSSVRIVINAANYG